MIHFLIFDRFKLQRRSFPYVMEKSSASLPDDRNRIGGTVQTPFKCKAI